MTFLRLVDVTFSTLEISSKLPFSIISFKKHFPQGFCLFLSPVWAFSLIALFFSFIAYPCVAGDSVTPDRNISVVVVEPQVVEWKQLWDQARSFVQQSDYINASRIYAELFQVKANIEEAGWEYCKVLLHLEDYSTASRIIAGLLENDSHRNEYLLAGGLIAYRVNDFSTAIKLYGKSFENNPYGKDSSLALEGLVNSLRKRGKKNVAFPLIEQLCLRKPENLHILHTAALDAQFLGKKTKAANLYGRLLLRFTPDDRMIFQAAKAFELAGLREKSAELSEEYLRHHPDYMVFRQNLVNFYTEKNDFSSAAVHLSYLALNLNENDDSLLKAGNMYLHKLGRPDKALFFYEKIITKYPENETVKQNITNIQSILANDFLSIVENDGSWLLWRDLARVTPNRVGIYLEMAELLEQKGMTKELVDILTIIYYHSEEDDVIAFRIAEQFYLLRNYGQALKYLVKIRKHETKSYYLLKGDVELLLGKEKNALDSYEHGLLLDKPDVDLRRKCMEIAGSIGVVTKLESLFKEGMYDKNERVDQKLLITYLEQLKKNYLFQKYQNISRKFIEDFTEDTETVMQFSLALAAVLQKEGKVRRAEQLLRQMLNQGMWTDEVLYLLAQNALELRNISAADIWYNALKNLIIPETDTFPYSRQGGRILLLKIKTLKLQGEYDDAITIVQNYLAGLATRKNPGIIGSVLSELEDELCWLFFYSGNYSSADDQVNQYIQKRQIDNNLVVLQRVLERIRQTGNTEKKSEKRFFVDNQPLVSRLLVAAESELFFQEYESAERYLKIVLKNIPESVAGNILMAKLFFAIGKFKDAIAILSFLSERFPEERYFYSLQIEIEMRRGKYGNALKILTENSVGIDSDGNILEHISVGNDIEEKLLLARLLWGNDQPEKCLEIYEQLLSPRVAELLIEDFAEKRINYLSYTGKETFWNSLFLFVQSEPELIAEIMEPGFLIDNRGNQVGEIVASYLELYSWQKVINHEYLARKAIFRRNYIYAEQSYKRLLEEENTTEGMIDLAFIYGRFGKYRKEAQVYKELKETGATSPQLTHSMERNTLQIRPRSTFDTGFDEKFGRDGHIDMSKVSFGTSFWFTPELNKDFSFSYLNNQYDSTDSDESAGSNMVNGSVTYEFARDYEMVFGAGVDTVTGDAESTVLYSVELNGQVDEYVGVFFKGEKKLVLDTVEAVKEHMFIQEVSMGLNYETPFGLALGGDIHHGQYNDGNSQNKFHGFSSVNYFGDTINMFLRYDYRYTRSEDQNNPAEDGALELLREDDLPYWSPLTYREHSLTFHFQHNFLGYQSGSKRGISYYSIDNTIGYEDDEYLTYLGIFNIFLEISPHFLLKSNFTFSYSDVFEEKDISLSLLYRW